MVFIIPDNILQQLICSSCGKYLSVKPVRVYHNRETKCGRCCQENDGGRVSLYENIIEEGLFRCINRYDGCNKMLRCLEVPEHEIICKGKVYNCPQCSSFEDTAYKLINHFKRHHKCLFLEKPEFLLEIVGEFENNYLYCMEDLVFFIYVKSSASENYIILNAACCSKLKNVDSIRHNFILSTHNEEQRLHVTQKRSCTPFEDKLDGVKIDNWLSDSKISSVLCQANIDISNFGNLIAVTSQSSSGSNNGEFNLVGPSNLKDDSCSESESNGTAKNIFSQQQIALSSTNILKKPTLHLSKEFKKYYPNFYLSADCTNLSKEVSGVHTTVFLTCELCKNLLANGASASSDVCDDCYVLLSKDVQTTYCNSKADAQIHRLLFFICRWTNCYRLYKGIDLGAHDEKCSFRPLQQCPVDDCQWKEKFYLLENHFKVKHPVSKLYNQNKISFKLLEEWYGYYDDAYVRVEESYYLIYWSKEKSNCFMCFVSTHTRKKCPLNMRSNVALDPIHTAMIRLYANEVIWFSLNEGRKSNPPKPKRNPSKKFIRFLK